MIILRTPKGWTARGQVDGHYLEGFWRAHQIPLARKSTPIRPICNCWKKWLRSYEPEKPSDERKAAFDAKWKLPRLSRHSGINATAARAFDRDRGLLVGEGLEKFGLGSCP